MRTPDRTVRPTGRIASHLTLVGVLLCFSAPSLAMDGASALRRAKLLAGEQIGDEAEGQRIVAAAMQAATTPRAIIVKLREGVDACLSCRVATRQSLKDLAPGTQLDALNRRFGVRHVRPLVPALAGGLLPRSAVQAGARWARAAARFAARAARAPVGATPPDMSRTYVVELRRRTDMAKVAREYAADPAVEYAEPDAFVMVAHTPDDPFLASQGSWGQTFDDLWGVKRIAAPTAWDTTRGAGVVVAITDTGIDYNHPDIAANIWTNSGEIPGNGIDDDDNGYPDDVQGWDFADDDADPLDDHGHGTHVAGTVAAVGDNGLGVVGVAYESQVMALRGLGSRGSGTVSQLAETILYAVDNGADVINASWGGSGSSQTIADAIAAAHAAGVVFVASAGNSDRDVSGYFPAGDSNAITVSAFDSTDTRASFSNFGLDVDVGASGGGDEPPPDQIPRYSILSLHSAAIPSSEEWDAFLLLEDGTASYLRLGGTSMASPHVAGVAALLLAKDPALTVEQVRQLLRSTADDVGLPGPDDDSGFGLVNAAAAVAAPPPLVARIASPRNERVVGALSIAIMGSASGPGFESYTVEVRPEDEPDAWTSIAGPIATPVDDAQLAVWDMADVVDATYVLRLRAERAGESFVDRVRISLSNVWFDSPDFLAVVRPEGDSFEIRGTAAGAGFSSYMVEVRRPSQSRDWVSAGLTPGAPSTTPVRHNLLATLDISGLTEGDRFDFRLTVENALGTNEITRSGAVIDPTLRQGWPQDVVRVGDAEYLTVADLDDDGQQEILVGSGDEVVVFEPDGSIRPGWPQSVATSEFPIVSTRGSPIVADIAGDATPEVIATNRNQVFVWTPDGTLLPGFPVTLYHFTRSINVYLSAGDLDGDGKDEIVAGAVTGSYFIDGDGTELVEIYNRFVTGAPAVGDVDGDGDAEVAHVDVPGFRFKPSRGVMEIYDGDGTLLAEKRHGRRKSAPHASMADLDGDGFLEMQSFSENRWKSRMTVHTMNLAGKKVRLARGRRAKGRRVVGTNAQLSFADLDGNGLPEGYAYEMRKSKVAGEKDVGYFRRYQHRWPSREARYAIAHQLFDNLDATGGIAIGDLDGDGIQDLLAGVSGDACGPESCFYNEAVRSGLVAQRLDGSLVPKFPKPLPQYFPSEDPDGPKGIFFFFGVDDGRYNTPSIADLDGDGMREVLWVDPGTTQLFVWNVDGVPGPLLADWPGYHHDAKHSNVLP